MNPDDILDASALVWLFTRSTNKDIVAAALQAIAGFPRDFSAFYTLRDAHAITLVEEGFQGCFEQDTTIGLKWHLMGAEGASLYCKAWMNLTRGTLAKWPSELQQPLRILQDLASHPDAAAIASCVVPVSSAVHGDLIAHLSSYAMGDSQLSPSTVTWLLDSMIEVLVQWLMPMAVVDAMRIQAVPVLLRILQLTGGMPMSNIRSAAGFALYVVTCGPVDLNTAEPVNLTNYWSEAERRSNHCEDLIAALSAVAQQPEQFGVDNTLLETAAKELAKLAAPILSHSERFPCRSKESARSSLLHLLNAGRIGIGTVPDTVLVDVLRLLHPIQSILEYHPALVKIFIDMLSTSSHPDITRLSVSLLQPLLLECSNSVAETFLENDGINAIIRVAKSGDIDDRWLQINSWGALRHFVDSCIALHSQSGNLSPLRTKLLDSIFRSGLFGTLCEAIASRHFWLLERSKWIPTLMALYRLWPDEVVWRKLFVVAHEANGCPSEEPGISSLMKLEAIILSHRGTASALDGRLDSYETQNIRTMSTTSLAAQRATVRPRLFQRTEVVEDEESVSLYAYYTRCMSTMSRLFNGIK